MNDFFKKVFNFQPKDFTQKEANEQPTSDPSSAEDCHYDVKWSEEDQEFVATVKEFPSMSWLDETPDKALKGLRSLVTDTIEEMKGWKRSF